jgi:hypothetical protein
VSLARIIKRVFCRGKDGGDDLVAVRIPEQRLAPLLTDRDETDATGFEGSGHLRQ